MDPSVAAAEERVAELYAGNWQLPPETGPAAVEGADVWFISCGQAFEPCANQAQAFSDAAEVLGWNATIADGAADPTVAIGHIEQAIAAGADALALSAFDCSGIKNALIQATDAGMPVVNTFSADCNEEDPSEDPLFAATMIMAGYPTATEFYRAWDADKASYVIAKTGGQAEVVSVVSINQLIHREGDLAFREVLSECDGCSVVDSVEFTFADIGDGSFTQMVQSGLLNNADANVLFVPFDALYSLGVADALTQSGLNPITIGGEGFAPNMQLIRDGVQTASLALSFEWAGYGAADTVNRILAGEDPADLPNQGMGWQLVDAENNLPEEGAFVPDVDYRSVYEVVWTGS
jgi:ribose transport system substrate-binding protein